MKKIIISQSRILHLLTMFVIVPVSGFVSAWVAKHFPGMPNFSKAEIEAVFITGATSGLATAIHFLHGWQWWEKNVGPYVDIEAARAAKSKAASPAPVSSTPPPPPVTGV